MENDCLRKEPKDYAFQFIGPDVQFYLRRGVHWNDCFLLIMSGSKIGYYAFSKCTNLTSIELPSGVTKIDRYAFSKCTNLSSLTLPSGVKEIWFCTFEGCKSLTSVTLPSGVERIEYSAFNGCI